MNSKRCELKVIGFDTSYFVHLAHHHKKAVQIWSEVVAGKEAAVSGITLFELEKFVLQGKLKKSTNRQVHILIPQICHIAWLDNVEVYLDAAKYSYRFGLHATDALILAGLQQVGVNRFYTADSEFRKVSLPKLSIQILK